MSTSSRLMTGLRLGGALAAFIAAAPLQAQDEPAGAVTDEAHAAAANEDEVIFVTARRPPPDSRPRLGRAGARGRV